MSTFQGKSPKNTYPTILKTETGTINGSLQNIEDGQGNPSALNLSTAKVTSSGNLEADADVKATGDVYAVGVTSTTDDTLSPVLIDGNGKLIKFSGDTESSYDSGWKELPTYDSNEGYGVYDYTNTEKPKIRVINRVIFFSGNYLIGLDDTGLVTDFDDIPSTNSTTVETTDSGLSLAASRIQTPPILPNGITLESLASENFEYRVARNIYFQDSGGTVSATRGTRYGGWVRITFNADNSMYFSDLFSSFESPIFASTNGFKTSDLRRASTIVAKGDRVYDYTGYKNSFDSTGATDNAVPSASATDYHYVTFDGTDADTWGGANINMSSKFAIIDKSVSMADIRTIIDALTDA